MLIHEVGANGLRPSRCQNLSIRLGDPILEDWNTNIRDYSVSDRKGTGIERLKRRVCDSALLSTPKSQ